MVDISTGKRIIAVKNLIVDRFTIGDWQELGLWVGQAERVENYPRLFRSMRFGDDDYPGCALGVLKEIVDQDSDNLDKIEAFLDHKLGSTGELVSSVDSGQRPIVFTPQVFRTPDLRPDSSLVSVMMPFSSEFDQVYASIQSACTSEGFSYRRADDMWDDSTVIQDVFSLIFESFIVICDFSGRNPNVFYEAGIAHTLGKHVVPLAQHETDIPFDLRHHRYLKYVMNDQGLDDLKNGLTKRLRVLGTKRH